MTETTPKDPPMSSVPRPSRGGRFVLDLSKKQLKHEPTPKAKDLAVPTVPVPPATSDKKGAKS